MEADEVFRRFPLEGAWKDLADAISTGTGAVATGTLGIALDPPRIAGLLRAAFPELPEPDVLEGCTTHPALLVRFRAPGFGREAAKVVLVPARGALEARVRLEVPEGSYRKETLRKLLVFVEEIEAALESGVPKQP